MSLPDYVTDRPTDRGTDWLTAWLTVNNLSIIENASLPGIGTGTGRASSVLGGGDACYWSPQMESGDHGPHLVTLKDFAPLIILFMEPMSLIGCPRGMRCAPLSPDFLSYLLDPPDSRLPTPLGTHRFHGWLGLRSIRLFMSFALTFIIPRFHDFFSLLLPFLLIFTLWKNWN